MDHVLVFQSRKIILFQQLFYFLYITKISLNAWLIRRVETS
jgi:hypothetical protein